MKNFKGLTGQAGTILNNFRDALESNRREGRSPEWLRAANKATAARYKQQLESNANSRIQEIMTSYLDNVKRLNKTRKTGAGDDKVLHLNQAQVYLSGSDLATAIRTFDSLMKDPDNRQYKYLYEDYLKHRIEKEDSTFGDQAEQVINKYRSPEEIAAIKEINRTETLRNHAKTIDGLISENFENLTKGEQLNGLDLTEIWDEMVQNADNQAQ